MKISVFALIQVWWPAGEVQTDTAVLNMNMIQYLHHTASKDNLVNGQLQPTPLPFDALNEGDPLEISGSYLVREN